VAFPPEAEMVVQNLREQNNVVSAEMHLRKQAQCLATSCLKIKIYGNTRSLSGF
jgi:hypothetical protein